MSQDQTPDDLIERYRRLQRYVHWTDDDANLIRRLLPVASPAFGELVTDFYDTIETEPQAAKAIVGGAEQVATLKESLRNWLRDLFSGRYDADYVARRWRVGWQHVEIGLEHVFYSVALSRLRSGLVMAIERRWPGDRADLAVSLDALHRLIDLDAAIIQLAYESEYVARQRRAERQRGEEVFRRLVEAAGCLIVILRADRSIAYFNPFAEELTGFSAAAVQGKDYADLFLAGEHAEAARQDIQNAFQSLTPGAERSLTCRDGRARWVVWNVQWLDDFSGSPALLAVGQDVTEQKVASERSLQSERLAAIGQTVAGLAHESRNAFQRSQACLELLELELEGRPEELELVSRIQRALRHLHRLYEEVRDYAAPIKLDYQACDLAQIWRDAWMHLEVSRAEKQVQLEEHIDGVDLSCAGDWFAIGQVFRNILENAIVACPDPGTIQIHCDAEIRGGREWIRTSIRDNGPGVDAGAQASVFDAFFTTRSKGTGLGLAIARRIVEAHGGQISLGSSGDGAEFVIVLPRDKARKTS